MPDLEEEDFHLNTVDGIQIRGSLFLPRRPRAVLLFLHGFAEHRRRYRTYARWLQKKRFGFASIDLRGHGESGGRPGHIIRFEEYYQDLLVFLHWAREHLGRFKIFVGGHSLGSLIAIRFFQTGLWQHPVHGLVLSAPFLGFFQRISLWQERLLHTCSEILPGLKMPTGINPDYLTHNADAVMAYRFDPSIIRRPRARWLTEVLAHQKKALAQAPQLRIPMLLLMGLADRIVSVSRAEQFYAMLEAPRKKWIGYRAMYHEILNEPGADLVFADSRRWMKALI